MIKTITSAGCCTSSATHPDVLPTHQHDERYYTKQEVDKKVQDLDTETTAVEDKLKLHGLPAVTAIDNTTSRGLRLVNGRLNTDIKHDLGVVGAFGVFVTNDPSRLGTNKFTIAPQDTNSLISRTSIDTEYVNQVGGKKVARLEFIVDENQTTSRFNTQVQGLDAVNENHYVTKKQLDNTLDYIIEHGDNA